MEGNGAGPVRDEAGGGVKVWTRGDALYDEICSRGTDEGNGGKEERFAEDGDCGTCLILVISSKQ